VRRRDVLALGLGGALLTGSLSGAAPAAARAHRIGHLSGSGAAASRAFIEAFREGMRALGHTEPRHFVLEQRYAEGNVARLPVLARELVDARPDLLLVDTTPASLAAKAATKTIPIVMLLVADPVGAGIVASLARPGANVTGITNIVAELAGKRLELLKELVPGASRIAAIVNPDSQNAPLQMAKAEAAATLLGLELQPVLEVRRAEDLPKAFASAARARASGAIRMIDPLVFMLRNETAALAVTHRLPVIYPTREDVEAGGLISYGANTPAQFRQAAAIVDRILKGARPADLPIEQPTKFELAINHNAARAIGLAVPQSLMLRADEVIA
jgi:putative ABC transport system substrate-binding protein